ncbi:MAG: hypothetical protein AAF732_16635 [Pseudomonadota bacterium]
MTDSDRLTLVLIARIPLADVADFAAYEDAVLPLLDAYGGRLERRLRSDDGTVELHVVSFPSRHAFEQYRKDPLRIRHAHRLEASGATLELSEMSDVF